MDVIETHTLYACELFLSYVFTSAGSGVDTVQPSILSCPSLSLPPSYSGGVVGYHVTLPCQSCLSSCNNGHLWMYNACDIIATERLDHTGVCEGVRV